MEPPKVIGSIQDEMIYQETECFVLRIAHFLFSFLFFVSSFKMRCCLLGFDFVQDSLTGFEGVLSGSLTLGRFNKRSFRENEQM